MMEWGLILAYLQMQGLNVVFPFPPTFPPSYIQDIEHQYHQLVDKIKAKYGTPYAHGAQLGLDHNDDYSNAMLALTGHTSSSIADSSVVLNGPVDKVANSRVLERDAWCPSDEAQGRYRKRHTIPRRLASKPSKYGKSL
jgi:hypothetical protein